MRAKSQADVVRFRSDDKPDALWSNGNDQCHPANPILKIGGDALDELVECGGGALHRTGHRQGRC